MLGRDKEERRLKKAKITLMRNPKFALWSGILMVGNTVLDDDTPTARTNGRDEYYGRKFVASLDDRELAFVVLHENLHKAFRHLTLWRKLYEEDARLANMACDYVINLMLVRMDASGEFIAMPTRDGKLVGLLDTRFDKMNAKQVFDILKQEKAEGGGAGGEGEGFDEHDWDNAEEMSGEEKEELEREVDRALRQGMMAAKRAGTDKGDAQRAIGDLLVPRVDWREMLREFVKSVAHAKDASSWRRPNRRYVSSGVYMPSMISEAMERIVIGVDTSGSISHETITRFLSEVKGIAEEVNPRHVDLMYWDSEVAAHEEYDAGTLPNMLASTKPKGGGGTRAACVSRYIKEKVLNPECVVMLTDGEVYDWGEWEVPTIWAIVNQRNGNITAPTGKTVYVEEL